MLGQWRRRILVVLAIGLTLRACVLEPVRSSDNAMSPFLSDGDVGVLSKLSYGIRIPGSGAMLIEWADVKKGDIVVATGVGDPPADLARRVTGIPGDSVLLPGKKAPEVLENGQYFLSADQSNAVDSRQIGAVSRRAIMGKLTHIWLSADSKVKSEDTQKTTPQ